MAARKRRPARGPDGRFRARKKKRAAPRRTGTARKVGPRERAKRAPRARIARSIERTEAGLVQLGTQVKRGAVTVGQTRRLTPTRAGFKALGRELAAVQKATKVRGKPAAYSFQLELRYRGPDGKFRKRTLSPAGFPVAKAVRSWSQSAQFKGRHKGKRGTQAAAFRDLVESQIIAATFRELNEAKDVFGDSDTILAKIHEGKYPSKQRTRRVRKAIRDFKERRGVSFKVTIRREV